MLAWNDNLAAIFEPKLPVSFFLLLLSARLTTFSQEYTDIYCFHYDLKSNVLNYELIIWFSKRSSWKREKARENGIKNVYDIYTTFTTVVAAILASPTHGTFTWSYCSSIYRVQWSQ